MVRIERRLTNLSLYLYRNAAIFELVRAFDDILLS